MSGRITLQTIADHLGVSRTTISNAYNRPEQLTAELRQRILETATRLGYRGPSGMGRMLRTGRTGAIGVVFTEDLSYVFRDPDTTHLLQGVADASARSGIGVMLLPAPPDVALADTAIERAAVDGHIIFSITEDHPAMDAVISADRPVVIVDAPDLGTRTSFVGIDDQEGARLAASHLVELGHTRLAVLLGRLAHDVTAGPVDEERELAATAAVARRRIAGYRAALVDAGIDQSSLILWECGGNEPDSARIAAVELLRSHPEVTGLLCYSDQIAIGACQAAAALGRRVPDDLSVVGFDDVPRAARWEPALTTIRQPLVEKGRVAAEMLLDIVGGAPRGRVALPIELVIRESTASPHR